MWSIQSVIFLRIMNKLNKMFTAFVILKRSFQNCTQSIFSTNKNINKNATVVRRFKPLGPLIQSAVLSRRFPHLRLWKITKRHADSDINVRNNGNLRNCGDVPWQPLGGGTRDEILITRSDFIVVKMVAIRTILGMISTSVKQQPFWMDALMKVAQSYCNHSLLELRTRWIISSRHLGRWVVACHYCGGDDRQ